MKRKNSIKEEAVSETGRRERRVKITVASITDFVIKLERNT